MAAVAPLACLSRYMMTRTTSAVFSSLVEAGSLMSKRQLIDRMVHFRPIR